MPRQIKKREVNKKPANPKTIFDAVSVGEGFSGRYVKRKQKKDRNIAIIDPLYSRKAYASEVEKFRKRGFVVSPERLIDFIKRMKIENTRTHRITIDMPGVVTPNLTRNLRKNMDQIRVYSFRTLFREAKNILMPNGRIFFTTNDPKLVIKIIELGEKYGLKAAGWNNYTPEMKSARSKSNWIASMLQQGEDVFRFVLVLPLTQTHTKKERRDLAKDKRPSSRKQKN